MNTKNKYLPEKCVQVGAIGANSVCKEPAAGTTGPSPYVKGEAHCLSYTQNSRTNLFQL